MRRRACLYVLTFVAAIGAAGEASACFYVAPLSVRSADGFERSRADELRDLVRGRHLGARRALAEGTDPAVALAEMLVPNIRPVPIARSDCGPGEVDFGAGEEGWDDWLTGTYLARHDELYPSVIRLLADGGETLGRACNGEFRERFAAYLRRRLDPRQLRAGYLFFASRWDRSSIRASRIMRFEGSQRRPPVQWNTPHLADIARWIRRTDDGRALQRALDEFWRDNAGSVGRNADACSSAVGRWPAIQARILADIERQYPQTLQLRTVAPRR